MKKNTFNKIGLFVSRKLFFWLPSSIYLRLVYRFKVNKKLDLKNPKTYNEKLQWLKIHDHNPLYTKLVDKYEVKSIVSDIIGKEYIIPTYAVYDDFDDIDFDKLPNQFVIKCTNDSGGLVICKNKNKLDIKAARKIICDSLYKNYYYRGDHEWPYKNVRPRIIVEKYMHDNNRKTMRDYKFLTFDGKVKLLYVSDESHTKNQRIAFFDSDYKFMDIERYDYLNFQKLPSKPKNFNKMKKLAETLSKDICHLRVDFYEINGKVYFSELTFYTGSGFIPFKDCKWDNELGEYINLPKKDGCCEK